MGKEAGPLPRGNVLRTKVLRSNADAAVRAVEFHWLSTDAIREDCDIYAWCKRFVESLGYRYFFFVVYFPVTPRRKLELVSTNYPLEWRERYTARNYFEIDPVARAIVSWSLPFSWRSVRDESDESTREFWEEASQHGLQDGLVVSVRCAAVGRASLVMAGDAVPDESEVVKNQMGAALGFVNEVSEQIYDRLLIAKSRRRGEGEGLLTPHQTAIVQHLASGMTMKQVARQFGISPRAVQHVMDRVLVRLGASNTLEAKFTAWTFGLIEPGFEMIDIADIDRVSIVYR